MTDKVNEKRLQANRQNALKSTGPRDTSVTRLNAMKHGILSKELTLEGESKKDLENLGKRLRTDLAPENELELILVDRIVSSVWRLKRVIKIEREYLATEFDDAHHDWQGRERSDSEAWSDVVQKQLGNSQAWLNLLRYETALDRQIYKALHELMRLQAARTGLPTSLPAAVDIDVSQDS